MKRIMFVALIAGLVFATAAVGLDLSADAGSRPSAVVGVDPAASTPPNAPDTAPAAVDPPRGDAADEPGLECRDVDGSPVCDTFGESDEGPGTQVEPEARFECRIVNGTEVCDTFGETDEGPGTR